MSFTIDKKIDTIRTSVLHYDMATQSNFTSDIRADIDYPVDAIVVRQISYNEGLAANAAANTNVYLVWSSITNGIIGSFSPGAATSSAANTCSAGINIHPNNTIILKSPLLTPIISFNVYGVGTTDTISYSTKPIGNISIVIDFIKFANK